MRSFRLPIPVSQARSTLTDAPGYMERSGQNIRIVLPVGRAPECWFSIEAEACKLSVRLLA